MVSDLCAVWTLGRASGLYRLEFGEAQRFHRVLFFVEEIDLDDGVKQNYPKFWAVLARIPGVS